MGTLNTANVARAELGLGDAATLSVGTTTGTVAAGDDERILAAVGQADGVGGVRTAYKTADESVTSSAAVQDDDHLTLTVAASGVYAFEGFLIFDSADASADFKMTFAGPSGTTGSWTPTFITLSNAAGNGSVWLARFTLGSTSSGGAISDGATAQPSGVAFVGDTAGALRLQWAQESSSITPTFLRRGSWLRLHRLA